MKKALAGPAKRTAKKKPERRAMIAAARRRAMVARVRAEAFTRRADRRLNSLLVAVPRVATWTRAADRRFNLVLVGVWPRLAAVGRRVRTAVAPRARWLGRRLRPVGVFALRRLARLERRLLRAKAWAVRAATRASALLTPRRAICLTILASAVLLIVAQFVEYRAVEIGRSGYAGLPAAEAPTVGGETAGEAHAYLLAPVGLLAAALALLAMPNPRRRAAKRTNRTLSASSAGGRQQGLGRIVFLLGLLSLAVALLVDLPAGLDASAESARFSGAEAVLYDGFYAEIAAAAGLMLGGALLVLAPKAAARYHARPCRTRINLFARAASALRRRRRRRASSRGRATRRGSRRRKGAVSAPASQR
jgi:hypothetical protein